MKTAILPAPRPAYSALLLFALIVGITLLLQSCSNPSSSSPGITYSAADYSAPAFFNTETYGDTSSVPFPFCFPGQYLEARLGLTDTQVIAIQNLQDSLRLALQAKLDAVKGAGTINRDSVRALRLEYQTDLYTGVSAILTSAQLAELQDLQPPAGPPSEFGRGPFGHDRGFHGREHWPDTNAVVLTQSERDSIQLARIEFATARGGDTLSANQIVLIQNLQTIINADTTLTPRGRQDEFTAQLETILTAKQFQDLRYMDFADNRWHHR